MHALPHQPAWIPTARFERLLGHAIVSPFDAERIDNQRPLAVSQGEGRHVEFAVHVAE
jgi:hypothetical protein